MNKQHIIEEIRRTAKANGGSPLGRLRFRAETGIKESDWLGVYWVRWNDAVREAGLNPNKKTEAYQDEWLMAKIVSLARELGHFPVHAELRLKARTDADFPDDSTFRKFGSKHDLVAKVLEFCQTHEGHGEVLAMCGAVSGRPKLQSDDDCDGEADEVQVGFVYLLRSGRYHKIGRSNACGRRERELAIQLPEKATLVHEIRTDDPVGIEAYWHRRFEPRRQNGEWFVLTAADIRAFKRRRFM